MDSLCQIDGNLMRHALGIWAKKTVEWREMIEDG